MGLMVLASTVYAAEQYGPCCPMAKGHHASMHSPSDSASMTGPRFTCSSPKPIALTYAGTKREVKAMEGNGTLFVPERLFAITGATIEFKGGRVSSVSLGARTVEITAGSHGVKVTADGATKDVTWEMCPRMHMEVTYVPLRSMAEALGLSVDMVNGGLVLAEAGGETPAPAATPEAKHPCPADEIEQALGLTVMRGMANTKWGTGVGVVKVTPGSRACAMGVLAQDIIIEANGTRVKCPKDLAALDASESAGAVKRLTVVRDKHKMDLTVAK
jgi:hypothetical protein